MFSFHGHAHLLRMNVNKVGQALVGRKRTYKKKKKTTNKTKNPPS